MGAKIGYWLPNHFAPIFLLGILFLSFPGHVHSNQIIEIQLSSEWLVSPDVSQVTLHLLPDDAVTYSPTAIGFNTEAFIQKVGGYLSSHKEYLKSTGWTSAGEIIERVALENSINPRLLIALLEYRCGCVGGSLPATVNPDYLMGIEEPVRKGLYHQLGWVANQISLGYYGWRREPYSQIDFSNGSAARLGSQTNAGSAGLAYLLSRWFESDDWQQAVDLERGFPALYFGMFGNPWEQTISEEDIDPSELHQPNLILPFEPEKIWAFTNGPHKAWETDGALAALDFAPKSDKEGCTVSNEWVVAAADGVVARSENGAVVLDLDGDGYEQTGWAVLYMHVEGRERVSLGKHLRTGERIGHPSCEGARASGTHIHIARKYNGEWIDAGGKCPFVLDGWVSHFGDEPNSGTLTRNGRIVVANLFTPRQSWISRPALSEIFSSQFLRKFPHNN